MSYEKGQRIRACYQTSAYKPEIGGWRSEWVDATLEVVSPGMAVVETAHMEPARSKRQYYGVAGTEAREIGKRKRISALCDVEILRRPRP